MIETAGIETGYSLEELRGALLDDPYFMECIRDAAERVPECSPFPDMHGGWLDDFFDSGYDDECEEHHGYRWAMRQAETRDEIFEAVRLVFDRIVSNHDRPVGELACFEYHSQRSFGHGCSCPAVRYSIHEIGGIYFAWYFRWSEEGPMSWEYGDVVGSMGADDGHDERVGVLAHFRGRARRRLLHGRCRS